MIGRRITHRTGTGRVRVRLAVAALVIGLLSGCAATAPDLTDDAGARLQAGVLEVSRAAAADDLSAARTALDGVTTQLATDRTTGAVSPDRGQLIEASIVLVAADLTTLEQAAADAKAAATAAADRAAQAAQDAADAPDAKDDRNDRAKNKKKDD